MMHRNVGSYKLNMALLRGCEVSFHKLLLGLYCKIKVSRSVFGTEVEDLGLACIRTIDVTLGNDAVRQATLQIYWG